MASPLKVTRLDSPLQGLRRDDASEENKAPAATDLSPDGGQEPGAASGVVARHAGAHARSRRVGPTHPAEAVAAESPAAEAATAAPRSLWAPPALDEHVELVSTRLPVSLSRALERHTRALRDRHNLGSQKALPMQEVLAAAVWALGDPDDKEAADRLDSVYRSYRSRRMAAAARALEQS